MGNRGHVEKQAKARQLRSEAYTLAEICAELDCSKSSASLWTRGVDFSPKPRNRGNNVTKPHPMHTKKLAEIEECRQWGFAQVGEMSERDLFMAGLGLYAGDGAKTGTGVRFANSSHDLVALFMKWLRISFEIDERRLRVQLYLHQGLDLHGAIAAWHETTNIPPSQFTKPYRAVPDATIRHNKHVHGCAHISYNCARTLRMILGSIEALVS